MSEGQVWDRLMSDAEFVELSLPYFKKKYWSLHVGCCLIAKVNPISHPGVGVGYSDWSEDDPDGVDDYTRRPFQAAVRSIVARSDADLFDFEKPRLRAHTIEDPLISGQSVLLDTTVFVHWVRKRWPDQSSHFKLAWTRREARKSAAIDSYLSAGSGQNASTKDTKRRNAFAELQKELGSELGNLSDWQLAERLAKRIKNETFAAAAATLRQKFKSWRSELGG
ncbi:hypothetical protein [Pseudaestuariivita atlantica]|uniref:Uncharacterized protein n=1 Tax=Pseudaestuariivita atlantica TaxID=1317121 RepID=A0A0L1JTD5_9RHOB|nr:hypothetical protein [Pseudaestuariivita atlantica]KNG95021.1 hypothetical protein ATO11_06585 [Pseudaestuariivita atlantica]